MKYEAPEVKVVGSVADLTQVKTLFKKLDGLDFQFPVGSGPKIPLSS